MICGLPRWLGTRAFGLGVPRIFVWIGAMMISLWTMSHNFLANAAH
jgi:hypothetical protein